MAKYLCVGDLHDKASVILPKIDAISESLSPDVIILMGDYIDDWESTQLTRISNAGFLADWLRYHENAIPLIGNHDLPYLLSHTSPSFRTISRSSPGFDYFSYGQVHELWTAPDIIGRWKISYVFRDSNMEDWVLTHGGLQYDWVQEHISSHYSLSADYLEYALNDIIIPTEEGLSLRTNRIWDAGISRGSYRNPGPLWCDLSDIAPMDDSPILTGYSAPYNQIVGHTPVKSPTFLMDYSHTYAVVGIDTFSTRPDGSPIGNGQVIMVDTETCRFSKIDVL